MRLIHRLSVVAAALLASGPLAAQSFPTKPVKLIVNLAVGGPADLMARIFAEHLHPRIGQPVVVEALPGANGLIGAQALARAEPDGHTLLFTVENVVTAYPEVIAKEAPPRMPAIKLQEALATRTRDSASTMIVSVTRTDSPRDRIADSWPASRVSMTMPSIRLP